jgi:glycosyltransferase involved in cell wall biosynthesis
MKILYVIHQFYPETSSGTERFLLNLATSVQRRGHRADVVTYSFENKSLFQRLGNLLVREYIYGTLFVTAVRHARVPIDLNSSPKDPEILEFAKEIVTKGKYDLVHLAHPMRLAAFALAAKQRQIPYVLTLTDFWTICPKITLRTSFDTLCTGPEGGEVCGQLCPEVSSRLIKSRLQTVRDMLDQASVVTSPSRFASGLVQREFPDIRVTVVPHGVESSDFRPTDRNRDFGTKIVFAYCGGLSRHKGVDLLVSAFRVLDAAHAELRIYGAAPRPDQDYEGTLRKLAGEDKRIKFCGIYKEADVSRVFRDIDVLVIPSVWYETYSFTLHEAFASNVPVIASATGVLSEKIIDSVTGLTFPMGNAAGLAGKLKQVIDNPSVLTTIKKNISNFDCPLQEEEAWVYERIYLDVCSGVIAKPNS